MWSYMKIGSDACLYEWIEGWGKIPKTESASIGWAHHGLVVTEAGNIIAFHPGEPSVLELNREGDLQRSLRINVTEGHGITIVKEDESEYLWIADNGSKRQKELNYEYPPGSEKVSGQVVKLTLDGEIIMKIKKPPISVYEDTRFAPTSVTVNEERFGGNGDIWVADGYGASYVHCFDKNGNYLRSINGNEGKAGRFDQPHGVFIDRRKEEPELYIADRNNKCVKVYDLEGNFKRVFGSGFLIYPCDFVVDGDRLIIVELYARVTVLGRDDRLLCYLGQNVEVSKVAGWPNNTEENGKVVPTKLLQPGKFNSPHSITIDKDGNLYVAEWLVGGRITKLVKQ